MNIIINLIMEILCYCEHNVLEHKIVVDRVQHDREGTVELKFDIKYCNECVCGAFTFHIKNVKGTSGKVTTIRVDM